MGKERSAGTPAEYAVTLASTDVRAALMESLLCARVPITPLALEQAAGEIVRLATSDRASGVDVHLCNAYTLASADKDPAYLAMLQRAALNLADGKSVVWANLLLHRGSASHDCGQARGPDLFLEVFDSGQEVGLRHYLLGSTPEVLDQLQSSLRQRFPYARIVGAESPPFRELGAEEFAAQTRRIRASGAQVVWVGLGTPKQDWHVARLREALPCVSVAIGAAFDFAAGTKEQAPLWMRHVGLEWAHRLITEPRRLWKRYLFGNTRFLYAAWVRRG